MIPVPHEVIDYWNSFCDGGVDASAEPKSVCGDGIMQSIEVCDDGNTANGDGCTASCDTIEVGYDCVAPGEPCVHD